jgi:CubicO group peptidase (beta-lactamase class C family)
MVLIKKIKIVEYVNKKTYMVNTIDNEKLDKFSEFPIGSLTKLFTLLSILLLHQNKQLNIYDNIGKYIKNNHIKNLKIIDIVNHKSGIKRAWSNYKWNSTIINNKYESATQVYDDWVDDNIIDEKLKGIYSYSNIGYVILGYLIEVVTGVPYFEYIKNNILIPLKMNNTDIDDCNITLYNEKAKKLNKNEKNKRFVEFAAGNLKSCINDLIKFSKFIKLLDKNTIKILKETYINKKNDEQIIKITHNGLIFGSASKLKIYYDDKWNIKDIFISFETIKL